MINPTCLMDQARTVKLESRRRFLHNRFNFTILHDAYASWNLNITEIDQSHIFYVYSIILLVFKISKKKRKSCANFKDLFYFFISFNIHKNSLFLYNPFRDDPIADCVLLFRFRATFYNHDSRSLYRKIDNLFRILIPVCIIKLE